MVLKIFSPTFGSPGGASENDAISLSLFSVLLVEAEKVEVKRRGFSEQSLKREREREREFAEISR